MTEDTLSVICTGLMEAVHVQLPDEAVDFVVAEIARQDNLLELRNILDDELAARWSPKSNLVELIILNKKGFYPKDLIGLSNETRNLTRLTLLELVVGHLFFPCNLTLYF